MLKGGTADGAFQEQSFLWEKGAPVGADFKLFYFQGLLHAQVVGRKKRNRSHLYTIIKYFSCILRTTSDFIVCTQQQQQQWQQEIYVNPNSS